MILYERIEREHSPKILGLVTQLNNVEHLKLDFFISNAAVAIEIWDIFRLCPPPPPPPSTLCSMLPPVTKHESLHGKSLCRNMARASGGCK